MKLSEAIRLGAMLKPQGRGESFGDRTCALGAALEAAGARQDDGWFPVYQIWPIARLRVPHPLHGYSALVGHCCWTLNDHGKWTREQIADFVEQIERAEEAKQQPVAVEVAR